MTTSFVGLWWIGLRVHAIRHPYAAMGLFIALLAMLFLLLQSAWLIISGEASFSLRLGLLGGLAGFMATALS